MVKWEVEMNKTNPDDDLYVVTLDGHSDTLLDVCGSWKLAIEWNLERIQRLMITQSVMDVNNDDWKPTDGVDTDYSEYITHNTPDELLSDMITLGELMSECDNLQYLEMDHIRVDRIQKILAFVTDDSKRSLTNLAIFTYASHVMKPDLTALISFLAGSDTIRILTFCTHQSLCELDVDESVAKIIERTPNLDTLSVNTSHVNIATLARSISTHRNLKRLRLDGNTL
jgi:hypothetical protein